MAGRVLLTVVLGMCAVAAGVVSGTVLITKVTVLFQSWEPTVALAAFGTLAFLLARATVMSWAGQPASSTSLR